MKNTAKTSFVKTSLFALIASGALAACSSGSGNPVQDAVAAIEQQDYRSARIHLMTALRENSMDPKVNYLYAKTLIELGDGVAARTALEKLVDNPEYAERVVPLMARTYIFTGEPEKALELANNPDGQFAGQLYAIKTLSLIGLDRTAEADAVLDEGLNAVPNSAELNWIKGNRDLEIGNIDAAVQSAKRALEIDSDSAEALLLSGRIFLAKSKGEEALGYFVKARESRPDLPTAEFLRGAVLKDLGKRDEARHCFKTVLSESPNHPWATYFMAEMDHEDGKSNDAFERLQASKANLDVVPPALRLGGILEIQRGNHEQAISKLKKYLAQNPADAESIMALSRAYAKAGNDAEAFRTMVPLLRSITAPADALELGAKLAQKVNDPVATELAQRAVVLQKDKAKNELFKAEHAIISQEWTQAEKIYAKLLSKDSEQKIMFLNNAAMVQLNLGKADQAIALAQQAHNLEPENPLVQDTLGWILLQTRTDPARALTLIEQAATTLPDNGEIHWHLANALAVNGRKEDARQLAAKLAQVADQNEQQQLSDLLTWI